MKNEIEIENEKEKKTDTETETEKGRRITYYITWKEILVKEIILN